MFRILPRCCAAALAVLPLTSTRSESPQGDAASTPSCAAWGQGGLVRFQGHFRDTAPGSLERVIDTAGGRIMQVEHRPLYDIASGDDGISAWARDKSGGAHLLNSAFAKALAVSERWLTKRGWCNAKQGGAQIRPIDAAGAGGDRAFSVIPPGGAPVEIHFDRVSGQLSTIVEQLDVTRLIRRYSDWIEIPDGRWFARKEIDETPEDEDRMEIDFASVARAPASDARKFRKPPAPADFTILDGRRSTTVSYKDDGRTRVFVPVWIDGRGPLLFELDSGGHLILTSEAAAKLKISPLGSVHSLGGGEGIVNAGFARIRRLRIGEAVIRNQPIKILPLPPATNNRSPGPPRAGILGLELFERFRVHLDRRRKLMTLSLPHSSRKSCGVELPLSFTEDAPEVAGAFDGAQGSVELDVGNAGPAIVEGNFAVANGLAEGLKKGIPTSGSGVGGAYQDVLSKGRIAIGPFQLPGEVVSYTGPLIRGAEATHSIGLNVGEPILSQFDMTFDYAHDRVCMRRLEERGPLGYLRSGLKFSRSGNAWVIDSVIAGSPAEAAGLRPADVLASVNSRRASHMSAVEIRRALGQSPGTVVQVEIRRAGKSALVPARIHLRETATARPAQRTYGMFRPVSARPASSLRQTM